MKVRLGILVFFVILICGLIWFKFGLGEHVAYLRGIYALDEAGKNDALNGFWGDPEELVFGGTLIYKTKNYALVWRKFGPKIFDLRKNVLYGYWQTCESGKGLSVNFADYDKAIEKNRVSWYVSVVRDDVDEEGAIKIFMENAWNPFFFDFLMHTLNIECG